MGIRGAALMVASQVLALSYTLWYFTRKSNFLHLPKRFFGLDWRIAKDALGHRHGPFLMIPLPAS